MVKLLIPDMPTTDELLPYLRQIDERKIYSNRGPLSVLLQNSLTDFLRAPALPVSNGTAALEIALRALKLPRGSAVLVPAFTFIATGQAIWNAQLRPVLCDVDPDTWQMTPETAAEGMRHWPIRAAVPVSVFGHPVNTSAWAKFGEEHNIDIVIDAAGAMVEQLIGDHDRLVACYSMHCTKFIGAGEGGVIATRRPRLMERCAQMIAFGHWGTNAKISEYHAAVALASLARLQDKIERMTPVARRYADMLTGAVKTLHTPRATDTLLCVLLPVGFSALEVAEKLRAEDVETKQWYRPFLDEVHQFANTPRPYAMPNTLALRERMLGLPYHSRLDEREIDHVCGALARAIGA